MLLPFCIVIVFYLTIINLTTFILVNTIIFSKSVPQSIERHADSFSLCNNKFGTSVVHIVRFFVFKLEHNNALARIHYFPFHALTSFSICCWDSLISKSTILLSTSRLQTTCVPFVALSSMRYTTSSFRSFRYCSFNSFSCFIDIFLFFMQVLPNQQHLLLLLL